MPSELLAGCHRQWAEMLAAKGQFCDAYGQNLQAADTLPK